MPENLILVLGDQLSADVSSLAGRDPERDRVLLAEVMEEATYAPHHKKKIAFCFAAMRHFADLLREKGWEVDYIKLDDAGNTGSLGGEVKRAVERLRPARLVVTEPGEWRLQDEVQGWEQALALPVDILRDDRFFCSRAEFAEWAEGRKTLRMEHFYHEMRRKTGLLMADDDPVGGKWNFD